MQYVSGRGNGLTEGLAHLLDRFRAASGLAVRTLRLELMLLLVHHLQAHTLPHPLLFSPRAPSLPLGRISLWLVRSWHHAKAIPQELNHPSWTACVSSGRSHTHTP